jgi:hypothetical protein
MEGTGSKKRSKKSHQAAAESLKTAAEIALRDESRLIIDNLVKSCKGGDVQSIKLLYELAQGGQEVEEDFRGLAFGLDRN